MLKVFVCACSSDMQGYISEVPVSENYHCTVFADGEMEVHFEESLRGDDVYLIQSLTTSDAIIELMLAVNAAKLASAKTVTAVIPYLGYARQDRKSRPRVSIGAKVVLSTLEHLGVSRIITLDMHAYQEVAFVDIPVDHLHSTALFMPVLQAKSNTVFVAPDAGASKLASIYAHGYNTPMVLCHKVRHQPNQVGEMIVIGDVSGKDCIIVDDMCDTAGTLIRCVKELVSRGAEKVTNVFTHPVLSGSALDKLLESGVSEIVTTNSIVNHNTERLQVDFVDSSLNHVRIRQINVMPLLTKAIVASYNNDSIESLFVI